MIRLEKVSKSFGKKEVIRDMSFEIKKGEFVSIIGKSGSGKSTLLNMIGLLDSPSSGKIFLEGEPYPNINSKEATLLRRNVINYIFQSNALISSMTVKENLLVGMEFVDMKADQKEKLIEKTLEDLEIGDLPDTRVNSISGGESQRVAIARCILKPGDLILADEPTGSLDPKTGENIFNLLKELRDKHGKTIIMVTHDWDLAGKCDRVIEIKKPVKVI